MNTVHTPVLINELKVLLNLKQGDKAIDGTLDGGGHARIMLELVGEKGKVLGIERDPEMIKNFPDPFLGEEEKELVIAEGSYADMKEIAEKRGFGNVNAVLLDLGLSTWHLKESGRGFSYRKQDEPLNMRFDGNTKRTAAELLNGLPEEKLKELFAEFGEVRGAGGLAKKIVSCRRKKKIISVGDLLAVLGNLPPRALAKVFQALRVAVNNELDVVEAGVKNAFGVLKTGGRLAVISYHSLEDRIIKNFYKKRDAAGEGKIITKKPVAPSAAEIKQNPSSRSAKLRVIQKS